MANVNITTMTAANDVTVQIPVSVRIEGLFDTKMDVDVRGTIDGELRARRVIIHVGATLLGTVVAEKIEVFGKVRDGTLAAKDIRVCAGCDVEGDLYYTNLDIEEGSLFEGKSRRHDDPVALFPPD